MTNKCFIILTLFFLTACQVQEKEKHHCTNTSFVDFIEDYRDTVSNKKDPLFVDYDTLKAFDLTLRVACGTTAMGTAFFLDTKDSMMYETQQFNSRINPLGPNINLDTIGGTIQYNDLPTTIISDEPGIEDWINKRFMKTPVTQYDFNVVMNYIRHPCKKSSNRIQPIYYHNIDYLDSLLKEGSKNIVNKNNMKLSNKVIQNYGKYYTNELSKIIAFARDKNTRSNSLFYIAHTSTYVCVAILTQHNRYFFTRFKSQPKKSYKLTIKYLSLPSSLDKYVFM